MANRRIEQTNERVISGADVPSFGLTPQRVYSLNNGAGHATQRCKICHAEYRIRESEPCRPGHMAVAQLDVNSYLAHEAEAQRAEAVQAGVKVSKYSLPLGSEYMYHRGTKGRWSLPADARKTADVDGACQGIKRAVHERLDNGLCRKCYVKLLKKLARGEALSREVLTVTRRKGKVVHRNVVEVKPSPEVVSIARLEVSRTRKGRATKTAPVNGAQQRTAIPANIEGRLVVFVAIHKLAGADEDDRPYRIEVEARTISEARRLFAESFGTTVEKLQHLQIYKVDENRELQRVA